MRRVICFVDGFNVYHALRNLSEPKLRWLDLRALAERLIQPRDERLVGVRYYSALANWMPQSQARHMAYIEALKSRDVEVILGNFKKKVLRCSKCDQRYRTHEEKETDVNIALDLYRLASHDRYDGALLISSDSDFAPSVRSVLTEFPNKEIVTVSPPHRTHSAELIKLCTRKQKINLRQVRESLLPESIQIRDGYTVEIPQRWKTARP